jgi:hypothetical protein
MKTQRLSTALALALTTLAGTGCMEPFDPPSVLGAQVRVTTDPTRSTPMPGETVSVDWLVVAPAQVPPLAWGFAICPTPQSCVPVATGADLPMRFTWTVPDAGGISGRVQVWGQICEGGALVLTDGLPACAPGAKATLATIDLIVDGTGDGTGTTVSNRIPDLPARPLTFDGAPWIEAGTCAQAPTVALGSKGHTMDLQILAEDREAYLALDGDPPVLTSKREVLQISNLADAGELGRSFSFVEASVTDAVTQVSVTWDAPDTMPATGNLVQVYFVARDMRGGLAYVERTICLQ